MEGDVRVSASTREGLEINRSELVIVRMAGRITDPLVRRSPFRVGRDGVLRAVPGTGGIALNLRVGDAAIGLAADHAEPGVSIRNPTRTQPPGAANRALMVHACVGNTARVTSGPAVGSRGVVTGKHGGVDHVLVDFPGAVLRRLQIGDKIHVDAVGQGLRLPRHPDVALLNLAPRLLARWGIRARGGRLYVPVTHVIPASLMGSGMGRSDGVTGDCDIQLSDRGVARFLRLDALRLGDLVAIYPLDYRFGPTRRVGRITIGVVVHADSNVAGHGPGVTPLLVGGCERVLPEFHADANIAQILGLRAELRRMPPPSAAERRRHWPTNRDWCVHRTTSGLRENA